jgi:hypothetical protein
MNKFKVIQIKRERWTTIENRFQESQKFKFLGKLKTRKELIQVLIWKKLLT